MVFFYKRDCVSLKVETRYDNETAEYVAVVIEPDGRRLTVRFDRQESFRAWLETHEERLANERWAADGPPRILPDGWPHRPPLM